MNVAVCLGSEAMGRKRDRLLFWISSKQSASLAIYAGMLQYLALWIFPEKQDYLLAAGLFLYVFRVPYFIKIKQHAFVAQSLFFFSVEVVGLFLTFQAKGIKIPECYVLF